MQSHLVCAYNGFIKRILRVTISAMHGLRYSVIIALFSFRIVYVAFNLEKSQIWHVRIELEFDRGHQATSAQTKSASSYNCLMAKCIEIQHCTAWKRTESKGFFLALTNHFCVKLGRSGKTWGIDFMFVRNQGSDTELLSTHLSWC